MILMESSWSVLPHAPNIIAPRHSGLTFTPVRPSVRYCMLETYTDTVPDRESERAHDSRPGSPGPMAPRPEHRQPARRGAGRRFPLAGDHAGRRAAEALD